uniref:Uncharacterized protein n=1 Tax=Plectus sambesii TaxID=2011161 RepID=A0A914XFJ4_9BILA
MAKTDDPSWLAENGKKNEKLFIVISVVMLIVYGVIVGVATKYTTLINDVSTPLSAFLDATEALSFNNNNNDAYFSLSEKEKHIAKPYITSLWLLNSLAFTGIVIGFVAAMVPIIAIWKRKNSIHAAALVITIFNGLWSLGLFIPLAFEYMCGRDLPRQLSSLMENAARHNPDGEQQFFKEWNCAGDSASCEHIHIQLDPSILLASGSWSSPHSAHRLLPCEEQSYEVAPVIQIKGFICANLYHSCLSKYFLECPLLHA